MNTKRLAIFGGAVVVIAGGLLYTLGIVPPNVSSHDGQGAIGQRKVYRAEQPNDATVTPGTAPVAMQANAEQTGQILDLKNGQFTRLTDGSIAFQLKSGKLLALNTGKFSRLTAAQYAHMSDAYKAGLLPNQILRVSADQFVFQVKNDRFLAHMSPDAIQANLETKLHSNLQTKILAGIKQ
ncbi:MAG TPA: hypothetical protein VGT04_02130 [Acidobacteriaceae bacterium]|nr:hypothetical protein [Acidobacteriaceae bacterium]